MWRRSGIHGPSCRSLRGGPRERHSGSWRLAKIDISTRRQRRASVRFLIVEALSRTDSLPPQDHCVRAHAATVALTILATNNHCPCRRADKVDATCCLLALGAAHDGDSRKQSMRHDSENAVADLLCASCDFVSEPATALSPTPAFPAGFPDTRCVEPRWENAVPGRNKQGNNAWVGVADGHAAAAAAAAAAQSRSSSCCWADKSSVADSEETREEGRRCCAAMRRRHVIASGAFAAVYFAALLNAESCEAIRDVSSSLLHDNRGASQQQQQAISLARTGGAAGIHDGAGAMTVSASLAGDAVLAGARWRHLPQPPPVCCGGRELGARARATADEHSLRTQ